MEAVRERSGADVVGTMLPLREWELPVILALQRGATLLRDGDRWGDFRSPAVRDAFGFYVDLFHRGLAPLGGEARTGSVYQDFARGWLPFYVTGPWSLGEMSRRLPAELAGAWATAPLPAPDGEGPGASLAGGASLVVARGTPRAGAAWRVIEALSETEQQIRLHEVSGDLPARRSAWTRAGLADAPRTRAFWRQMDVLRVPPRVPEWERIATTITRHVERAARGMVELDDALEALDRDVDEVLEKRRWLLARAGERTS